MQNDSRSRASADTHLAAVPPPAPEKRRPSKWYAAWLALALAAGIGIYRERKAESAMAAKGQGISVPVTVAAEGNVTATVRAVGTVAAMKSASLTAPRILGSRSGVNRGGDTNFGGPAGGGADFNLVLLSLTIGGTHVKAIATQPAILAKTLK